MIEYQWRTVLAYLPDYLHAAVLALRITVLGFLLAFALAVVFALARDSASRVLRFVGTCYVEVIRNTPVLLQIFIVYFAFPSMGVRLSAVAAGTIALGVNVGAYLTEVVRAGFSSVDRGQLEAAQILGLSRVSVFAYVVAPQALRNVYPSLVNNLVQVLLGTSLLSTIAVPEITGVATVINARTLLFVQVFGIAVVAYLILSYGLSVAAGIIRKLLFRRWSVASQARTARRPSVRHFVGWRS
ncbi:MAG: polar amino acid transport system permease protein [Mycobacterium sp.]|jgi:polar amino acid transport system permease protein|nr:polar amino acid transport system permease protein [Mycobacterium sp.]